MPVVVEKRGYGIDAPGSWWKERASVKLDAAVLHSLVEAGCRIVRSPPGEGRVWAFLRAGKSRGEGRVGGRGWAGDAPRRGRGAGISPPMWDRHLRPEIKWGRPEQVSPASGASPGNWIRRWRRRLGLIDQEGGKKL